MQKPIFGQFGPKLIFLARSVLAEAMECLLVMYWNFSKRLTRWVLNWMKF
jgi:hypothetical protein